MTEPPESIRHRSVTGLALAWSLGMPVSYLSGWSIGYFFFHPYSALASQWGGVLGLSLGGALCGLAVALHIQDDEHPFPRRRLAVNSIGWAVAFFSLGWVWFQIAHMLD